MANPGSHPRARGAWALKTFDGREKSLLRGATRDVLPSSIVERVKSPYPSTQDPGYEKALREQLSTVLADRDAPVRELIDPASVQQAVDAPQEAASIDHQRAQMEKVLQLDAWMRRYHPALDL